MELHSPESISNGIKFTESQKAEIKALSDKYNKMFSECETEQDRIKTSLLYCIERDLLAKKITSETGKR